MGIWFKGVGGSLVPVQVGDQAQVLGIPGQLEATPHHAGRTRLAGVCGNRGVLAIAVDLDDIVDLVWLVADECRSVLRVESGRDVDRQGPGEDGQAQDLGGGERSRRRRDVVGVAGDARRVEGKQAVRPDFAQQRRSRLRRARCGTPTRATRPGGAEG